MSNPLYDSRLAHGLQSIPGLAKAAMANPWVRRALMGAGAMTGLGAGADALLAAHQYGPAVSSQGLPNGGFSAPPTDTQMNRRGSVHPLVPLSPSARVGQAFDTLGMHGPGSPGFLGFGGSAPATTGYYPGAMSEADEGLADRFRRHALGQPQPYVPTQDVPNAAAPLPPGRDVGYAPGASPQAMAAPPLGAPGQLNSRYDNNGNASGAGNDTAPTPSSNPLIQQFITKLMQRAQ